MKIKDGVILAGLHPAMRKPMQVAERIYTEHGQELVITSGLDGCHSPGSWHYSGRAIDIRTHYFDEPTKKEVFDLLAKELEIHAEYRVYWHPTHLHIDYPHI